MAKTNETILHVLIKVEGGIASFEAATDKRIQVTIIDHDTEGGEELGPVVIEDHGRVITTASKLRKHIEQIRNHEEKVIDL